jgi:hypothetical protein
MTRPMARAALTALIACALLTSCAGNQRPPPTVDPLIVPELAVEVDQISLFNADEWTSLNQRMVVVWSGRTPYLLAFDAPCRGLASPSPLFLAVSSTGSTLYARFDSLRFRDHAPCRIDRIYRITRDDVKSLREAVKG